MLFTDFLMSSLGRQVRTMCSSATGHLLSLLPSMQLLLKIYSNIFLSAFFQRTRVMELEGSIL